MATIALCRGALARHAVPLALGTSAGVFFALRQQQQQPIRLDALPFYSSSSSSSSRSVSPAVEPEGWLSPEVIRQLSGGSLAGFLSGVLVSVFSKTVVLLTGVAIVVVQMASRYGVDILGMLKLRQRVESSRILSALSRNPSFKLAFGTTFALAAFMQF